MKKQRLLRIEVEKTVIEVFDDVSVEEAFDAWKCGESLPVRYEIQIIIHARVVAKYVREFENEPPLKHFNNFIKKFLRDRAYRAQFQVGEEGWNEIIHWDDPVNPQTRGSILRLNKTPMKKLKFKDFMKLKVGGYDNYSRMKVGELDLIIPQEDKEFIEKELTDQDLIAQAKRWVARGLKVHKSIRKVKTDQEIQNNMR